MKRLLVLILLALFAVGANAAPPECVPKSFTDVRSGNVGGDWWFYWPCTDSFSVWFTWRAVPAASITPTALGQAVSYVTGKSPTFPLLAPTLADTAAPIASLKVAVWAAVKADKTFPVAPIWTTAKNGTYTSRPGYTYTGTTRASVSTVRAPIGAACQCATLHIIEGSTTYCPVTGATSPMVAACVKS